jgi:tRNA pseudouridine38-40 synthase
VATIRLEIEYDGSRFSGWARQLGVRTVQAELETALETVLRVPVELTVAGRTDTGVHARGQVASFEIGGEPPAGLAHRINGVGPADLTVLSAAVVADGFDARRDALSRSYRYRVLARSSSSPFEQGRSLWWPFNLDRELLDACAASLLGTHDFTAFTPTQTEHVRFKRDVLAAEWRWQGDIGSFLVTADSFMRNMVRVLVGTQLEIAAGRRRFEDLTRLLDGAPRSEAGETAPPHGLCLESVRYR